MAMGVNKQAQGRGVCVWAVWTSYVIAMVVGVAVANDVCDDPTHPEVQAKVATAMQESIQRGYTVLSKYDSCGSCVKAGGGWCLSDTPKCVPDSPTLCDAGPANHVGLAGHGRCPERADFETQVYFHAPRRPPLQPGAAFNDCEGQCGMIAFALEDAMTDATVDTMTQTFRACGAITISNFFPKSELLQLRKTLLHKLPLGCAEAASISKYSLFGLRGSNRQELVLPSSSMFSDGVLSSLRQPSALKIIEALVGHTASIEFASLMISWPGAGAQEYHRDVEPNTEAAVLVFIPLDEMWVRDGAAGPPEMCLCSHSPHVEEKNCSFPWQAESDKIEVGSALIYDSGLTHRGLRNQKPPSASPRLMLHLVLSPPKSIVRIRPGGMLGSVAQKHIQNFRDFQLTSPESTTISPESTTTRLCSEATSCNECRALHKSWRSGCAWCIKSATCVVDVTAMCDTPSDHVGTSGLKSKCPGTEEL
eukprot:m.202127 g.202127  ORF g.202127 m.202127 type:complete len:477 (+) comp32818_c1_seq2:67-1497(+)